MTGFVEKEVEGVKYARETYASYVRETRKWQHENLDSRGGKDYKISFRDNELSMVNIYMTEDRNCNILELRRGVRAGETTLRIFMWIWNSNHGRIWVFRGHFDRKEETAKVMVMSQVPSWAIRIWTSKWGCDGISERK